MRKSSSLLLIILFICFSLMLGCTKARSTPVVREQEVNEHPSSAYPSPEQITPVTYPEPILDQTTSSNMLNVPSDAPIPEPGMAAISGIIYSYTINRVIPNTMFYLTQGIGSENRDFPPALIGPLESKGDITAKTNEFGQFGLNNVPPGNYYLVVEAPYNWSVGQVSDQNHMPRLLELRADQKYVLGIIYVSWP